MVETYQDKPFVPRLVVILTGLLAVVAALVIGIFVFLLPNRRARREYSEATCVVVAAASECAGDCRELTVTSESFEGSAKVVRSGRAISECSSAKECSESFKCSFKLTEDGRVAVREDLNGVPLGFSLFMGLAGVFFAALGLYVIHEVLRIFGIDLTSAPPVLVVLFAPPGVDVVAIGNSVKARWPRIEARSLSYCMYVEELSELTAEGKRVFETPRRSGAVGLVFCVAADGRNERALLQAVPESFYRVLLLPTLEDCKRAAARRDIEVGGTMEEAEVGINTKEKHAEGDESTPQHLSSASEDKKLLGSREVEDAYHELEDMKDLFDSVYAVGSWEFGRDSWITVRALSPYVPFRVGLVSRWQRFATEFERIIHKVLGQLCCSVSHTASPDSNG